MQLRDYQQEAVDAILASDRVGEWDGKTLPVALVSLPTGTGKTHLFPPVVRERGGRALVLAHRDELLRQARSKLVGAGFDDDEIGIVKAEQNEVDKPVILASVQTLARKARREKLFVGEPFKTLIIDEAHHSPAASYKAVVKQATEHAGDGLAVVGVTATHARKGMEPLFKTPVFHRDLAEMIAL